MIRLGLTGSIAMGKSTVAGMFRDEGVPVIDADAAVAELYKPGGKGSAVIGELAPQALDAAGGVDRTRLSQAIAADPALLERVEARIHPLVGEAREREVKAAEEVGHDLIVFDIPLLFETGADGQVDKVAVVSAPEAVQRERALARQGMSAEKLDMILHRQLPDAQKRARADYVIDTGVSLDETRAQVRAIILTLTG